MRRAYGGLLLPLLMILLVGIAVAGCATNPYTHRHQLELVPASQEQAMGPSGVYPSSP